MSDHSDYSGYLGHDFNKYINNAFTNNFYIYGVVTDVYVSRAGLVDSPEDEEKIQYNSSVNVKDSDNNDIRLVVGSYSPDLIDILDKIKVGQLVMAYGYLVDNLSAVVAVGINPILGNENEIDSYNNYALPYDPSEEEPIFDDSYDYGLYNIDDDPLSDMPNTNDPEVLRDYAINNPEIPDDYFE